MNRMGQIRMVLLVCLLHTNILGVSVLLFIVHTMPIKYLVMCLHTLLTSGVWSVAV